MDFLQKLRGNADQKEKALVFMNYDEWFYTYKNRFGIDLELIRWKEEIEQRFQIEKFSVFINLNDEILSQEITALHAICDSLVDTQQESKKKLTTFVMLDHIYRSVKTYPEIHTYIIFSGNEGIKFVVKYLKEVLGKNVIVYCVRDAYSSSLLEEATEGHLLPKERELKTIYEMIVENLAYISKQPYQIPTFMGTVAAVARRNDVPESILTAPTPHGVGFQ